MAFDSNNYVTRDENGLFVVVVDGQFLGRYDNQGDAERAFNSYQGNRNNTPAPTEGTRPPPGGGYTTVNGQSTAPPSNYGGNSSYASTSSGSSGSAFNQGQAAINQGLAASNQMDLDERKRQFDEMYKIELRKLGLNEQQIENQVTQFWASFGGQLLSTAASLRGPGDWVKYQEYTSGGKDIWNALTGQTPIAAFGAPTGRSDPASITDIMRQMGIQFPQSVNLPSDWSGQISNWYNQYKTSHNGQAPSEQELKGVFKQVTGFNDDIANKWYTQGVAYARQFGGGADQATQERWLGQWIPGLKIRAGSGTLPSTGSTGSTGGTGGTNADDAYLDYIWSKRTDLENHYRSNGWDVSTPQGKRAAVRNWLTYAGNTGKTAEQIARELGYSGTASSSAATGATRSAGTGTATQGTSLSAQPVSGMQPLAAQSAGTGAMGAMSTPTAVTGTVGAQTVTTPGQPTTQPGSGPIYSRLPSGWSNQIVEWYKQQLTAKGGVPPSAEAVKAYFKQITGYDDQMANKWYQMGQQYSRDYRVPADEAQQMGWLRQWESTYNAPQPRYTSGSDRKSKAVKRNGIWMWGDSSRGMPEPGKYYTQVPEPLSEQELRELGLQNDSGVRTRNSIYDPNQPATPTRPQAPLPHQVNPAVWDSLSPTAQQMILASAEAGDTPSGAWDRGDYLRQLNAARPRGTAPRRISTNWGRLGSSFS